MGEHQQQQTTNQALPEFLYHYTDQKGLFAILESDCLRATHYRFLNDTSERQEAIRYLSNAISRRKSYNPAPGIAGQVKEHVLSEVQRNLEKELQAVDAYFVCFTQENMSPELRQDAQMLGDRLSQWRGYALGRQGFSLGFQRDRLMSGACELPKTNISVQLVKCIYSDREKDAVASTFVGYGDIEILRWEKKGSESNINNLSPLKREFHRFSSGFKHIGFKEETEWRLAFHMLVERPALDMIKLREDLTPYIRVPLKLKSLNPPLKQIVVGPSQNKDQMVDSLNFQLAKMNIRGVEVVPSKIPYRNW